MVRRPPAVRLFVTCRSRGVRPYRRGPAGTTARRPGGDAV